MSHWKSASGDKGVAVEPQPCYLLPSPSFPTCFHCFQRFLISAQGMCWLIVSFVPYLPAKIVKFLGAETRSYPPLLLTQLQQDSPGAGMDVSGAALGLKGSGEYCPDSPGGWTPPRTPPPRPGSNLTSPNEAWKWASPRSSQKPDLSRWPSDHRQSQPGPLSPSETSHETCAVFLLSDTRCWN